MTRDRWRKGGGSEAGIALVETVVSAAVLLVVAMAALSAIDRAQTTSALGSGRNAASTLAEQDQERMRSMKTIDLSNYRPAARTVNVDGLNYTVTSRADWVRDATGATESCTTSSTNSDYLKISSTVAPAVEKDNLQPITISSLVSPPIGAFGANQGTLTVKVLDRNAAGVASMPVSVSGPSSLTNTTNSLGCAVFSYVPIGTYRIVISQSGWVDTTGAGTIDVTQPVTTGTVNVKEVTYDRAATFDVTYDTKPNAATGYTTVLPSRGWQASAVTSGTTRLWQFTGATPPANPVSGVTITSLFPFASAPYRVYSGACTGADPTTAIPNPNYFTAVAPGASVAAQPQTNHDIVVRQPAANFRVTTNGTTAVANADVVLLAKTGSCANTKFVFTTDSNGWATKPSVSGFTFDSGVPFGTYDVCADNNASTSSARRRRTLTGQSIVNADTGSTPQTFNFNQSGTTTGSSAVCSLTGTTFP